MPHVFLNNPDFGGNVEFQTHSAILSITPYSPKVLIVGTYNEANIEGNHVDFFYGRNYFWPVLFNLVNIDDQLIQRRDVFGIPPGNPTLPQILGLCAQFELTFADLVTNVLPQLPNHGDKHLNAAIGNNEAITNEDEITQYISETRTITHVYATTKFGNFIHIENVWNNIIDNSRPGVTFGKILTPSGMGGIPNFEGLNRAATIARYWLWVNHPDNPHGDFVNQDGYTFLDHNWLAQCGVDTNLF